MKFNKTLSIFELQKKSANIKRDKIISIILGVFLLIFTFALSYFKYLPYKTHIFIIYIIIMSTFVLFSIRIPNLSSYEEIRHNLAKSIEFLEEGNYDKSKHNLNEIAINLESLLEDLETIDILSDFRYVLNDFLLKLKLDIYPNISDIERKEEFLLTLIDIQKALTNNNQTDLMRLTQNLTDENNIDIELPYEKPNLLSKFLKLLLNNNMLKYGIKFILIFFITSYVFILIGNHVLPYFSLTPDNTSFIGFLTISFLFTNKFTN